MTLHVSIYYASIRETGKSQPWLMNNNELTWHPSLLSALRLKCSRTKQCVMCLSAVSGPVPPVCITQSFRACSPFGPFSSTWMSVKAFTSRMCEWAHSEQVFGFVFVLSLEQTHHLIPLIRGIRINKCDPQLSQVFKKLHLFCGGVTAAMRQVLAHHHLPFLISLWSLIRVT